MGSTSIRVEPQLEVRGLAAHRNGSKCAELVAAAELWMARRDRSTHPEGYFDYLGRWYPGEAERRECCEKVVQPSGNYRFTLSLHCRTTGHVAALRGVDPDDLRVAAKVRRRLQAERLALEGSPEERQKVAAGAYAPREVLVALARDDHPAVREAAQKNHRTPTDVA